MTNEEAIRVIEVTKAECEWNAPLDYQVALDMAISALEKQDVPDTNVGDLISRQAVIDALNKLDVSDGVGISSIACDVQESAIIAIQHLPSAKPEQRWIPVSERMPEESGWYIVTTEDETDTHLRWFSTLHGFEWEEKDNTIAWMPLPKPYEGES